MRGEECAVAGDGDDTARPAVAANPRELYQIPVVEISERRSTSFPEDPSNWGDHCYLMPHWYRNDDDPEHVLELDPVSGKFLPQSVLRAREEEAHETGAGRARKALATDDEKSVIDGSDGAPKHALAQNSHSTTNLFTVPDIGISTTNASPCIFFGSNNAQSYQATQTRKPWAGETRPNLIRLFPPPSVRDPNRDAKIRQAILEAKKAESAPDIVPGGSINDEEVLQLARRGGVGVVWKIPFHIPGKDEAGGPSRYESRSGNREDECDDDFSVLTGETGNPDRFKLEGFAALTTYVREMFSIQQGEFLAIPQCLELAVAILDRIREVGVKVGYPLPVKSRVVIFSDSHDVQKRLGKGINVDPPEFRSSRYPSWNPEKRRQSREKAKLYHAHTLPILRSAVWYSYELRARNCDVEIRWIPRRKVAAAKLADDLAGRWKQVPVGFWNGEGFRRQQEKCPLRTADGCRDDILAAVGAFQPGGHSILAEQRGPAAPTLPAPIPPPRTMVNAAQRQRRKVQHRKNMQRHT